MRPQKLLGVLCNGRITHDDELSVTHSRQTVVTFARLVAHDHLEDHDMSDADFARLLADLTRMATRLAAIDALELGTTTRWASLPTPRETTGRA